MHGAGPTRLLYLLPTVAHPAGPGARLSNKLAVATAFLFIDTFIHALMYGDHITRDLTIPHMTLPRCAPHAAKLLSPGSASVQLPPTCAATWHARLSIMCVLQYSHAILDDMNTVILLKADTRDIKASKS
jgi:hypothetical protein